MSCQDNGNCPLGNQDKLDAELKALMTRMLIKKLSSELEEMQSKNSDKKTESPQHKERPGLDVVSQTAITDMVNTQTKLAPILLNHRGGRASIVIQSGQTITIASIITLGATLFAPSENQFLQILLFCLGFLGGIIILSGFFWDPDRPGRRKRGHGSGKKSKKQHNSDNKIDKSENDDDMQDSLNSFEPIIEHMIVSAGTGSGKSTSFYKILTREQSEEQSLTKYFWISVIERIGLRDKLSKYLKLLFHEDIMDSAMYDYLPLNSDLQRMYIEASFTEIIQIDFQFRLSQLRHKVDKIMIDLKSCDLLYESEMDENIKTLIMLCRKELNREMKKKELISFDNYRSSSEFDKVFKVFFHSVIRKLSEEINLQRDIKMSNRIKKGVNYEIDDSFQLYKEKKQTYPIITHNYLFQIPEIKRLSQNLRVTKESNILNHKFSFALKANTNQCSTEDEQIQVSISNNQKTKSNKLLRKKINLNLN